MGRVVALRQIGSEDREREGGGEEGYEGEELLDADRRWMAFQSDT